MPRPTLGVSWRKCKVTNSKGQHRITWPKDFAEVDEVLEGTFIYDPFEKNILFQKNMKDEKKGDN